MKCYLLFGWYGTTPMGFFGLLYGNIGIGEYAFEYKVLSVGFIGLGFRVTSPLNK